MTNDRAHDPRRRGASFGHDGRHRHSNEPECDPEPILTADQPPWPRPDAADLDALRSARIVDCQLVPWGSNYTFAVSLRRPGAPDFIGIYKPGRGEIPLWDFDAGTLYRREYASYLLSCFFDWRFIPPTVIRDGPHGIGTVQRYVEPDPAISDRDLRREHRDALARIFVFDIITNNADRKSSHCFVGRHDRKLWGIDHGLTFHVHPKLRTVLWDFCGEPIDQGLLEAVAAVERETRRVRASLRLYLEPVEIDTLFARMRNLQETQVFPMLNPRRNIPYGW